MLASTTISVMTTRTSISVKPALLRKGFFIFLRTRLRIVRTSHSALADFFSPIFVLCSVERRRFRRAEHVVDILSAPAAGVGFVLIGPLSPFVGAGHWIDRNPAQKLELSPGRVIGHGHAVDERVE